MTVPTSNVRFDAEISGVQNWAVCENFKDLDFTAPIDVEAHARAYPPDATVKGMFFIDAIESMRAVSPQACEQFSLARQHYAHFGNYSQLDYLRLIEYAARTIHPNLPFAQAVREIAWSTYPRFARSTVGRVVSGALGNDMDRLVATGAKAWALCSNRGHAEAVHMGERHWHYNARGIAGILDAFVIGIPEGMFRHMRISTRIMINRHSDADRDFCVRW